MRSDMAKVIVERPRYGSRRRGKAKGYRKYRQLKNADVLAKRESIKFPHRGELKSLNEHLGPLRRYLLKQVGRPWNKVFAEICEHLSRDSAVQDHVRDHVGDFVATNVVVINDVLHEVTQWKMPIPLQCRWHFQLLFVCPHTGILKRNARREHSPRKLPTIHIRHAFGVSFIRKSGVWYRVELEAFPKKPDHRTWLVQITAHDAFENAEITRAQAIDLYGRPEIATEVHAATPQEIRSHCEPLKSPNRV